MDRLSGVLVAGAINTDLVAQMKRAPEAGETITGSAFSIHPGGKGANQAVSVVRSGVPVSILGAIGRDDFGAGRLDDLRAEGIGTGSVSVVDDAPSGVAMIFVEEGGENRIAYVPGATLLVTPEDGERALTDVAPRLLLATNELPHETLAPLFALASRRSIPVVFNATPDPETALPLVELVDILIVNEGEARALAGLADQTGSATPEQMIQELQRLGPDGVVITLGSQGVIGRHGANGFRHRSPRVQVVDSTGAGDTFCGAMVARLMDGAELSEAAHYGVHAGALAVTKMGAQPSIPDGDAIRRFMESQTV
jgi:ribokinase